MFKICSTLTRITWTIHSHDLINIRTTIQHQFSHSTQQSRIHISTNITFTSASTSSFPSASSTLKRSLTSHQPQYRVSPYILKSYPISMWRARQHAPTGDFVFFSTKGNKRETNATERCVSYAKNLDEFFPKRRFLLCSPLLFSDKFGSETRLNPFLGPS